MNTQLRLTRRSPKRDWPHGDRRDPALRRQQHLRPDPARRDSVEQGLRGRSVLAFNDINPLSPTHILVIPKGAYVSWDDFSAKASDEEIGAFVRAVGKIARDAGLVTSGYRLLANAGLNAGQEVPHLHVHIFAGRPLGPMLAR